MLSLREGINDWIHWFRRFRFPLRTELVAVCFRIVNDTSSDSLRVKILSGSEFKSMFVFIPPKRITIQSSLPLGDCLSVSLPPSSLLLSSSVCHICIDRYIYDRYSYIGCYAMDIGNRKHYFLLSSLALLSLSLPTLSCPPPSPPSSLSLFSLLYFSLSLSIFHLSVWV